VFGRATRKRQTFPSLELPVLAEGSRPSIPQDAIQALSSLWVCPSALSDGAGRCRPVYRSPRWRRSWRA